MASKKPSGLGRGLGALLGDDVLKSESSGTMYLPITSVENNSSQPRKIFDDAALAQLAESISQHGIIQPLTVRKLSSGYYQIIAGERRWRAARLAGLKEVPVVVIEADDRKAAELAMIENLQREDLNPIEEAAGFRTLITQYHMTQEEAANRVGKSRSAVTNALRLLDLDASVQKLVQDGILSAGHARALVVLPVSLQIRAANAIVEGGVSVRQTEALVKKLSTEKKDPKKPAGDQVDYAFIANGGDMSTGAWDTTRELADEHFETYERLLGLDDQDVPVVWTPGNHDDAPYRATEERVGQKSLSDQIGAKNRASGVVSPEGCCYGYLDLEEYSLRVIVLDTDDKRDWGSRSVGAGEPGPASLNAHNIGADQLIWLAETALNFSAKESPGAWKIVVVSHVPLNISGWFSDSTSGKGYVHSTANGAEILNAYKNGKVGSLVYNGQRIEYDFSDDPGRAEIICLVHGHEHKFINRNINGLLSIGCPNVMNGRERSSEDGVVYSKTPGTGSGTSFCIFTVDTQERRIYVDAVGAGYDRVFSY